MANGTNRQSQVKLLEMIKGEGCDLCSCSIVEAQVLLITKDEMSVAESLIYRRQDAKEHGASPGAYQPTEAVVDMVSWLLRSRSSSDNPIAMMLGDNLGGCV